MNQNLAFEFTPTLVGNTISLRKLTADDFDELYAAASDPLIWEQHPFPCRHEREEFENGFFAGALASDGALVITDNSSGKIIGSSRYYEWNQKMSEISIGYTFLERSHWGNGTNEELKRLMLNHSYRWVGTVWFHVGVNNLRSRKAVEKIGGKFSHEESKEIHGVIHNHAFYKINAPDSTTS